MSRAIFMSLCFILCLGACTAKVRDVERASREVAEVTARVKAALVEAQDIDAAAIRVRLEDEEVLLDGFVGSEAESARAESLAREQVPERKVINRIEIR